MANPSANKIYKSKPSNGIQSFIVKNATQLYAQSLVGVADADGYLNFWDNVATTRFCGVLLADVLGDTSAGVEGTVDISGRTLTNVAVAGTPTQAKVNELVYSADGNITSLTMTATTSKAIGILTAYRSASDCDVRLFSMAEFAATQV